MMTATPWTYCVGDVYAVYDSVGARNARTSVQLLLFCTVTMAVPALMLLKEPVDSGVAQPFPLGVLTNSH